MRSVAVHLSTLSKNRYDSADEVGDSMYATPLRESRPKMSIVISAPLAPKRDVAIMRSESGRHDGHTESSLYWRCKLDKVLSEKAEQTSK
jgi:hypothetical protein